MDNSLTIIWIIGLLTTAIVVLLAALRYGIDRDGNKAGARRAALDIGRLKSSFRSAVTRIEQNIAEHGKRYDIPWVVLLHDGSAATRPAIERCGLTSLLAEDAPVGDETLQSGDAPRWHLFDRGVVVELTSEQLDDPASLDLHEKRWEAFVQLCGQYRPQRPLDSIIISVPAGLLADRTPEGRERLRLKADAASRRIWIAQNRYAMRFAVYVVVSGCEDLPGFGDFAQALPPAMQDSMLGWSSPYQPSALYQPGWVTQAFDQVEQNVADVSAELFASHAQVSSPTEVFLLPSRIAALRSGMAEYLEELMRPNAFHEPFFLRGLYFSGAGARPLFLRDVMDAKVFAEFGLARAAHSQKLARPLMTRIGRWLAVGIPMAYAFGLLFSVIQLNRVMPALAEGLEGLKRDAEYRAHTAHQGERLDFEWYRKTALQLMIGLEELQSRRLSRSVSLYDPGVYNPFIPGSWPMFDDLRERARNRIKEEFAEMGVRTLQHAIYRRTAELSNAPLNPVTARLTGGATDCDGPLPGNAAIPTAGHASVSVEHLGEFTALQRYANDAGRLETSVGAMQRLKSPHKNSARELRMLVLDMLGADLTGDLEGSIQLFRDAAVAEGTLIDQPAIATALRCGFVKSALALNRKLFQENALVRSEERVQAAKHKVLTLFDGSASPNSGEVIAAYRQLQEALHDQKTLLAHGHGGWVLQDELKLGASYDKLMQQFANNKLIGAEIVADVDIKSREDFTRTRQQFLALFGEGKDIAITAGKDGGIALSKDRQALVAAVEQLLGQPFMQPAVGNALEPTARGTLLNWDNEQLARAARLGDGRRKYLSDDLPRFPGDLQEAVRDVIDYQYALRLVDLAGHAFSPVDMDSVHSSASAPSWSAFEQASGHVKKLVALLKELGQDGEAQTLQTILAHDASARLRLLNGDLQEARAYQVIDESDDARPEQRSTLNLFAGGGGDVTDYLNQQLARMQALSAQAQVLRTALPTDTRGGTELARWQAIARELELHAAKDPRGSIVKLERFLTELARELDAPTCLAALKANEAPKRPTSFFAERHAELHRAVTRRCMALDRRSFVEQWTAFANDFNRLLKGRRPFIGNRSSVRGSEYAAMSAADLSETGNLLNRMPAVSAEIFARNNVPEGSVTPIRDFALLASQVRQLLAPLFPADASQAAALDVAVRFRANVNGELDGNKIIDWALSIGDQTLKLRDTPRPLRWKAGDPVRLTLRFANDVPLVPRADPDNPYLEVSRKSVVFRFDGPWALLDMVQLLRVNDAPDARSSLLKLEVPVQADPKDSSLRAKPVRAFVGITLSEPGKTAPLPWPQAFPERAPAVER